MPPPITVTPDPSNVRLGVGYGLYDGAVYEFTGTLVVGVATADPSDFHSPAQIVRQLLIDINVGSDQDSEGTPIGDWPCYESNEPAKPDETITVYDIAGPRQGRTNPDGEMAGPDGVQIRVRSKTKRSGYSKGSRIADEFTKSPLVGGICYNRTVTVEGIDYKVHAFSNISEVIPIGKESPTSTRRLTVINCVVTITRCP